MTRNPSFLKSLSIALVLFLVFAVRDQAYAQPPDGRSGYPKHLPYRFENFVWWSDEELRLLLKKRISGLGDEIGTTNAEESRMRDALTTILKEKGIVAHVQSEEPSYSAVDQSKEVVGMPLPPRTPPVIAFSILTPEVRIGKITVHTNGAEAELLVQSEVKPNEGRLYELSSQAFWCTQVEKVLSQQGYLAAKARFQHGQPRADGGHFLVDLSLIVDAGLQYHIAAITADGGPLLHGRDLGQFFTAKPGDLAGLSPFWKLGPELRVYYSHAGYADAHVEEETILDHDRSLVTYHLSISSGPLYHLRSVKIEKLTADQQTKVRELLGMHPGDVFQDDAINALYRKIADEPLLKGYSFSFGPKRDRAAGAVDLRLDFYKDGVESSVTIK